MDLTLYSDILFEQELNAIYANGDLTPEEVEVLEIALIEHQTASIEKTESLLKYAMNLVEFESAAKAEEERIRARRKQAERIEEKIKEGIKTYMLAKGYDTLTAGTFKLSMRKSTTVELEDIKLVPAEYKIVTVTEQLDKMKVKEAIKKDGAVIGCHLEEHRNLQIR